MLREVDLHLPAGTLVRIVGTNGTGKSTLLRLVAGVDAPGEGRVTGRPARTAYVPERFPAALPFTAADYLVHLARIQGLGRAAARAAAGEWLERLGAAEHAGTDMARLSKGSSQKIAVVQAFLADPALLVLDEAWTGLDTGARAELDAAVRERRSAGATVVFVDHDPRRLAGEADAVYAVESGRVRETRQPDRPPTGAHGTAVPGDRHGTTAPGHPAPAPGRLTPAPGRGTPGHPALAPGHGTAAPAHPAPAPGHGTAAPGRLTAAPGHGTAAPGRPAPGSGSLVRIAVSGGAGPLPRRLPGDPVVSVPEPGDTTTVLTVDAAHSDALLGALLAASWHIHHLTTEGVRV
ncbi:ATP-binding cassette domain-containing protein [Streptomyces sp. NPDC057193]|uniref:ABC transporter ATP-binding protein n=1 Tax=Streptomyces sp. NPDC057193 TaxID=3346043 RepID=UPI00363D1447